MHWLFKLLFTLFLKIIFYFSSKLYLGKSFNADIKIWFISLSFFLFLSFSLFSFFLSFVVSFLFFLEEGRGWISPMQKTKILKMCLDYLTPYFYHWSNSSHTPQFLHPQSKESITGSFIQTWWRKEIVANWLSIIYIYTLSFSKYNTQLYQWRIILWI